MISHFITAGCGQYVIRRQIKLSETQNLVPKLLGQDCKKCYGLEC
jgi:hypothetical protein